MRAEAQAGGEPRSKLGAALAEAQLLPTLDALRRGLCPRELDDPLFMYACELGHPKNFYGRAGLPRMHNAWEMQLLVDEGLLFYLYWLCTRALLEADSHEALASRIEQGFAAIELDDPAATRARTRACYAREIEAFVGQQRAGFGLDEARRFALERALVRAYLRLAVSAPAGVLTLDLFPANTGPNNVSEGLLGLVSANGSADGSTRARRFWSIRAESFTRYYGINLAKQLRRRGLHFGLVVPYANSVRHIAMTRCWPIDGAENIARYVSAAQLARRELLESQARAGGGGEPARAPVLLVSGYSQGGAAVRLFNDALSGLDPSTREYFRRAVPRGYLPRCRTLESLSEGRVRDSWPLQVHSVSIATMGGVDGLAFAERFPRLLAGRALARDQRGGAGVLSRANHHRGVHVAICHDLDPARWIVPGPLVLAHRRLRGDRRNKHNLVRILLRFGGPAKALHGGVWTQGTRRAFANNPAAQALLDDVCARTISSRFVDQAEYYDERCTRAAFPHLVMGALGYPGWAVVAKFAEALEQLERSPSPRPGALLLREPSWRLDILPRELIYDEVVGRAQAFDQRLRSQAQLLLSRLEARSAHERELAEALRERFLQLGVRRHLLEE